MFFVGQKLCKVAPSLNKQCPSSINLDLFLVRSVCGNYQFEVASSNARGRSGGLLTIWDPAVFSRSKVWSMENFLVVEGEVVASKIKCYLINVYAPEIEDYCRVLKPSFW